jgi:hypothetical protein
MAERYDKEFIDRVGIYYETHEKTAKEVSEHFSLSQKTVESWVSRLGWSKGKYKGRAEELKKSIDKQKQLAVVGAMNDEGITDAAVDLMGGDTKKAQYLLENIALESISSSKLDEQMLWAVQKAQVHAIAAKNIGTIKTYAEIVKMAKETIHGKSPDTVLNIQLGDITPQQMASMSDVELRAMMKKMEEEISSLDSKKLREIANNMEVYDGNIAGE